PSSALPSSSSSRTSRKASPRACPVRYSASCSSLSFSWFRTERGRLRSSASSSPPGSGDRPEETRAITPGETMLLTGLRTAALAAVAIACVSQSATAQKKYDTGAGDTEIKIGNIMPYSGPASAYGVIGKTQQAYFNKINAEGGINGRKINFIS